MQQRTDFVATVVFHPIAVVALGHLAQLFNGRGQGAVNLVAQPQCVAAQHCQHDDQADAHAQSGTQCCGDAALCDGHQQCQSGEYEQVIPDAQALPLVLQAATVGRLHGPTVGVQIVIKRLRVPQFLLAGGGPD